MIRAQVRRLGEQSGDTDVQTINSAYGMRTYTAGARTIFSTHLSNEFRLNYSSNEVNDSDRHVRSGGSAPKSTAACGARLKISRASLWLLFCTDCIWPRQEQHPVSVTVELGRYGKLSLGRHQLKFGVDYRRLAPFAISA